jgi:hypothetical protein
MIVSIVQVTSAIFASWDDIYELIGVDLKGSDYPVFRKAGNTKECQDKAQSEWVITEQVFQNLPTATDVRYLFSQ